MTYFVVVVVVSCVVFCGIGVQWINDKDGLDLLTHTAVYEQEEANDADSVTNYTWLSTTDNDDHSVGRVTGSTCSVRVMGTRLNHDAGGKSLSPPVRVHSPQSYCRHVY